MAIQKPKIVYWKPGGVVRAQQVYLDANFLLSLSLPDHIWHLNASGLLQALQERKITLVLSSLALNEVIYQHLKLARQNLEQPPNPLLPPLPWPDRLNEAVLKLGNLKNFEPPDPAFHRQTIRGVAELGLDPTDAFHYAAARYLNAPLVSNDAGFQKIADQHLTIVTFY
ncbi:MAG: type II toxin-antitoxin system VapC family toxin [Chloroflexota bacterium]|nr:type II toxin-antitoxin system VapC family toxin [Chloroflexota bacterium]